jgi:hypothetical protein
VRACEDEKRHASANAQVTAGGPRMDASPSVAAWRKSQQIEQGDLDLEEHYDRVRHEAVRYDLRAIGETESVFWKQVLWTQRTYQLVLEWMVETAEHESFADHTLHLSVLYLDRFLLRAQPQNRDRLQAYAIGAMMIASKLEEKYAPTIDTWRANTGRGFEKSELVSAEKSLLATLGYDLIGATAASTICLLHAMMPLLCEDTRHVALYLAELALLVPETRKFTVLTIAQSALLCALRVVPNALSTAADHYALYLITHCSSVGGVECSTLLEHIAMKRVDRRAKQHIFGCVYARYASAKRGKVADRLFQPPQPPPSVDERQQQNGDNANKLDVAMSTVSA